MTHPDLHRFLRHLITCPPADVPGAFLVFADWLEEQQDERCGVVRKIVARGAVEVLPLEPRNELVQTAPGEWSWRVRPTKEENASEMLHRLRVRCLTLFRDELWQIVPKEVKTVGPLSSTLPGYVPPLEMPRVDPRWPPLPCPVCDATMCRCEGCRAEWCLEIGLPRKIGHTPSQFVGECPECGESPRHWRSGHDVIEVRAPFTAVTNDSLTMQIGFAEEDD